MIEIIERQAIWRHAETGVNWFHPRATVLGDGSTVLMTLQSLGGSDVFGPVHESVSSDGGHTWMEPTPVPPLGRTDLGGGRQDGVCDVVPEFHSPTGAVLAMGHTVHYLDERLTRPYEDRRIVYAVRDAGGSWSARKTLEWDSPEASGMYSCGSGQRQVLEGGDVLVPVHFLPVGRPDFAATTLRCSFDGRDLGIVDVGRVLRFPVKRGFFEGSVVWAAGRFLLTLRAEDERGHVAVSPDGLAWADPVEWRWDDGAPLAMSSTQQHWLSHGDDLYLVYTRRAADNADVLRWRSPLFAARVDVDRLRLIRSTERVVIPLAGRGDNAAGLGNFHAVSYSATQAWVTVGEESALRNGHGDTWLARIAFGDMPGFPTPTPARTPGSAERCSTRWHRA